MILKKGKLLWWTIILTAFCGTSIAAEPVMVRFETGKGNIIVELMPDKAPKSVENFLHYVDSGYYDGLIFHRVIPGFMIQTGGFQPGMQARQPTREPIPNEADNGLLNQRGSLAMARTNDPHSATAQFFINVADNGFLNHTAKNNTGWGYAVFGRVTEGMEVADAIVAVPTGQAGPHNDVPNEDILILSARRMPSDSDAAQGESTNPEN